MEIKCIKIRQYILKLIMRLEVPNRNMRNKWSTILVTALLIIIFQNGNAQPKAPLPKPRQLAWQKAAFGVIFHYYLHVFDGKRFSQIKHRVSPLINYKIFNQNHFRL